MKIKLLDDDVLNVSYISYRGGWWLIYKLMRNPWTNFLIKRSHNTYYNSLLKAQRGQHFLNRKTLAINFQQLGALRQKFSGDIKLWIIITINQMDMKRRA